MKVAGFYVAILGVWLIATIVIGGMVADPPASPSLPMVQGFLLAAPWTGLAALGVALIVGGVHIYYKDSKGA